MTVKFGTDGWRAIISDEFTFDNLRLVAQAIADFVHNEGTALSLIHIYASDLQRAATTAGVVADALGLPLTLDPIWRERGIGQLEGLTTDEIVLNYPCLLYTSRCV